MTVVGYPRKISNLDSNSEGTTFLKPPRDFGVLVPIEEWEEKFVGCGEMSDQSWIDDMSRRGLLYPGAKETTKVGTRTSHGRRVKTQVTVRHYSG